MFILLFLLGVLFTGLSLALLQNDYFERGLVIMVLGICLFVASTFTGVFSGYAEGRVRGLVESGKYEIVTNEDYSLKELESFLKIDDFYLKEIIENGK